VTPLVSAVEMTGTVSEVALVKFMAPFDVRLLKVPTLVSEDVTTDELSVVPVRLLASTVMVMLDVPSKLTPLMVRGF